jgi:uncharacterized membrane protein YdjX (TVP38/TMEM64 family)
MVATRQPELRRASTLEAVRRFAPIVVIVLILVGLYLSGAQRYFTLESLRAHSQELQALTAAPPVTSVLGYIALYAGCSAVCLPFNLILTLASGLLFGPWVGGAATVVGAAVGSLGAYYAAHTAFGEPLRRYAERRGGSLQKIIDGFGQDAFSYVLSLRLVPVFPFWFVSLAAGIASPPVWSYVAGTGIGVIPACFIYAGLGAGLGKAFASGEPVTLHSILTPHIVLPLLGLSVLSVLPAVITRWRRARA